MNISDVLTSVQVNYAASPNDSGDNNEVLLGSLELSVTPSQSVDGKEPVTQEEDVPGQLLAEKEKVAGKITHAFVRRKGKAALQGANSVTDIAPVKENMSKALHDDANTVAEVVSVKELRSKAVNDGAHHTDELVTVKERRSKKDHDGVDPTSLIVRAKERRSKAVHDISASTVDVSLDMGANVASSPVSHTKKRVAIVKKKQKTDPAASPRRSPRVLGSSVDGSTRHSSRILEQKKASPLAQGKSTSSKVKQVGSSVFLCPLLIEVPFVFVYV